jgi:hypothetical protein
VQYHFFSLDEVVRACLMALTPDQQVLMELCGLFSLRPLPRQGVVLQVLEAIIFSFLEITNGFFQKTIKPEDRCKTTFVTSHRGLEQMTISAMGLASSPGFFQYRRERDHDSDY